MESVSLNLKRKFEVLYQNKKSKFKKIKVAILFFDRMPKGTNSKEIKELQHLQWRIVGSYLCIRKYYEKRIWITKLEHDSFGVQTKYLPLDQLIQEESGGQKLIDFSPIPSHSFLTIKRRGPGIESKYYANLLQVTNKNEALVYDLDSADEVPKEINFVFNIEELSIEESFINTGFNHWQIHETK